MAQSPGKPGHSLVQLTLEELKAALLDHKQFLANGANGKRAVVQFSDLSGFVLTGVDLTKADLTGSKLTGAKLDDADLFV